MTLSTLETELVYIFHKRFPEHLQFGLVLCAPGEPRDRKWQVETAKAIRAYGMNHGPQLPGTSRRRGHERLRAVAVGL